MRNWKREYLLEICKRRSRSMAGIVDEVKGLGAMARAVAPELF